MRRAAGRGLSGARGTLHVLAAVVANVEDLGFEAEPVEEAVDLFADVGLAPGRHCLSPRVRPTMHTTTFTGYALYIDCIYSLTLHHITTYKNSLSSSKIISNI